MTKAEMKKIYSKKNEIYVYQNHTLGTKFDSRGYSRKGKAWLEKTALNCAELLGHTVTFYVVNAVTGEILRGWESETKAAE